MSNNKPAEHYWEQFCTANSSINVHEPFQTWYFGNSPEMARDLAELVISGRKTATASLAKVNEIKPGEAPIAGGFSVVTDFEGNPLCVIRTVEIRHLPFNEVDAEFAFDEGEGDRTLEYWQNVHKDYFEREANLFGIDFDDRSIVCCERFTLLYPR